LLHLLPVLDGFDTLYHPENVLTIRRRRVACVLNPQGVWSIQEA
jgi:hypothetical protein